jgi:BirA family biotin operon repressor/biotin-[acetyl-CoA-carboxylase] ligase
MTRHRRIWQKAPLDFQRQFYYHQNAMTTQEIQPYITSKIFGKNIFTYDVIGSTNIKAKSLIQHGEGVVVIAEEQTAGRGRLGRSWISEPKKNLMFSVIIKPKILPDRIGIISLYAGLSVAEAMKEITKLNPVCKWPNDVLLNGKKFCGILSEAVFKGNVLDSIIVGIGINVNQSDFTRELQQTATSLFLSSGKEFDRFKILGSVLERLERNYALIQSRELNDILQKWKKYTTMFGKEITINQNGCQVSGIAERINDDGGLILRTNKGEGKFLAGDVTLC